MGPWSWMSVTSCLGDVGSLGVAGCTRQALQRVTVVSYLVTRVGFTCACVFTPRSWGAWRAPGVCLAVAGALSFCPHAQP